MVIALDAGLRYMFRRRSLHRVERWWPSDPHPLATNGVVM
jgi:hypothetical protein